MNAHTGTIEQSTTLLYSPPFQVVVCLHDGPCLYEGSKAGKHHFTGNVQSSESLVAHIEDYGLPEKASAKDATYSYRQPDGKTVSTTDKPYWISNDVDNLQGYKAEQLISVAMP